MEETPPSPPVPPVAPAPPPPPRRLWQAIGRRIGEMAIVFFGVYAAFLLNNHQNHRQERQRREQILAWMESNYTQLLAGAIEEEAELSRQAEDFRRRLAAGEMPRLAAFNYRTDYNPADTTSLLGSGGFDLLEVETVRRIKRVEGSLRQMIDMTRHDQQLSDTLILPNLGNNPAFFYEADTKRLRPSYRWYEEFFDEELKSYDHLRGGLKDLLKQIKAERQRNG